MNKILNGFIAGIIITLILIGLFWWANKRDKVLAQLSECVVKTAKQEGYVGNPYGEKSYKLFISKCIN